MIVVDKEGIRWFLDDEDLVGILGGLSQKDAVRRVYTVRDYKGGKVFVKFFHETGLYQLIRNRVDPRGKKEYDLGKRFIALSLPTPSPLGYGLARTGSFVIQEWIDGNNFLALLDDKHKREKLFAMLVSLLGDLKRHHVRHNDLHLENIIGSSVKLYLVDLHSVTVKRTFTPADDVSNATHALAMIYDGMDEIEKQWFFGHYGGNALRTAVEEELGRFKRRWVTRKAARAFRTTSVLDAAGDRVTVRGMEGQAQGARIATIKKDRKVTVERYADHVRKIYTHARRLHRAWKNHVVLEYMRLSIAPRACYLQRASYSEPGYIALEDLTGKGEELDRYLDRNYDGMSRAGQRGFVEALSSFLVSVLKKGITHRDLKACNIFVLQKEAFLLLDVEDLDFSGFDEGALKSMLIQLNTTIPKRISLRDRIRFFSKIMRRLSLDGKWLLKEIASESHSREIVYEGVGGLKRESWG